MIWVISKNHYYWYLTNTKLCISDCLKDQITLVVITTSPTKWMERVLVSLRQNHYQRHLSDITRRCTLEDLKVHNITEYCFHGCFTVLNSKSAAVHIKENILKRDKKQGIFFIYSILNIGNIYCETKSIFYNKLA